MKPHQIGIVVGFIALLVLGIIITYYRMSDGDTEEIAKENVSNPSTQLPSVPKPKDEGFSSKLNEVEQQQDLKQDLERKERLKSEIDLDILDVEDEKQQEQSSPISLSSEPVKAEKTAPKTKKSASVKKRDSEVKPKKQNISANTEPVKVETVQEVPKKEIDPDLQFSSNDFSTGSRRASNETVKKEPGKVYIPAVVHQQVTATQGSRVTLRTTEEIKYDGKVIPKNTILYATVRFNDYRVQLSLPPITFRDGSYLLKKVYTYDGNDLEKGLYARELLENEAASETAGEVVDNVNNEIPSGVVRTATKALAKGRIKEKSVTLRMNHPVIIME
jgi:hypothetical protein